LTGLTGGSKVAVMRWAIVLLAACVMMGCSQSAPLERSAADEEMFGPAAMRFSTFTKVRDWTEDKAADGVDVHMEMLDQFGDPTKASGTILFELYEYRAGEPEMRGPRRARWPVALLTVDDQRQHWKKISRTYSFKLNYTGLDAGRKYVLTAMFEGANGGRLFAQTVPTPQEEPSGATTRETTQPSRP
jgi:hypothetical protein